jgi:hypothetical protein
VKRWLAVVVGGFGLAAYLRRRRRRRAASAEVEPADELRAKLAEARREEPGGDDSAPEAVDEPEPDPNVEGPARNDLGQRRNDVHGRARQALDELR